MRKRDVVIVTYLNNAEKECLDRNVKVSGLSQQAYTLKALTEKEIKARLCDHHPALLKALSEISNNTGHILRAVRANGQLADSDIETLQQSVNACWKHIRDNY